MKYPMINKAMESISADNGGLVFVDVLEEALSKLSDAEFENLCNGECEDQLRMENLMPDGTGDFLQMMFEGAIYR